MKKHLVLGLLAFASIIGGCGKTLQQAPQTIKGLDMAELGARGGGRSPSMRVTNLSGQPLADAQILIGTEVGKPFAQNFITADAQGNFSAPSEWTTPLPVTISAPGYIRVTFMDQAPGVHSFSLRPVEGTGNFQLTGVTTGFQIKNGDGLVDFAVVIPALQKRDFFSFDVSMVLSHQTDKISIIGNDVELPSNASLPKQSESYFFPINLEKPIYRMYFKNSGEQKVVTLRGQFPLKDVVDAFGKKQDFSEMINLFSIQGGSLETVKLSGASTHLDLSVNKLNFAQARKMTAPDFREDQEMVIAAAVTQTDNVLYPTDVKNLTPKQVRSLQVNGPNPLLVAALKRKTEVARGENKGTDRVSAAILPFAEGAEPHLLPLLDNPRLLSDSHLQIPAVKPVNGVNPSGTYATLASITESGTGKDAVTTLTTQWEVYAPAWASEIQLPTWPKTMAHNGKMRWGVTLIGQSSNVSDGADLGPGLLENATHATHSSLDF